MALPAGTRFGPYEITGPLGAGGMGEVYRATDSTLGRQAAIKTLPTALAQDPDRLARFEREAKLLAALNHPHIGAIYGLDEHDGTRFLAMELIEGETLEAKLKNGPLPVEDALRLALQIAEALEAAHDKGVVHRDLKPANVMVTRDGQVKVLDFGLAKSFSGDPSAANPAHSPALSAAMTQAGLVLGTAGYMSPEQASGQATDQRADIWAFGVVLYEMLTGLPLFSGESVPHILADVLRAEPNWNRLPKNLHPRIRQTLERCLKKKVRDRYHSIADARVDIEEVLRDPNGVTAPAAATPAIWRRAWPAAATLVVGALVAGAYFTSREAPTASAPAGEASQPITSFIVTPPLGTQLANQGGLDVVISPDGQRIAYWAANLDTGHVALYSRGLDELESRLVPGSDMIPLNGGNMNPFFSPDGQSIGFFDSGRGVLRVSIDGAQAQKMLDPPETFVGGSWNDDNTLTYSSGRKLERASAAGGGTPEVLADFPGRLVMSPKTLPGGRAVLFSFLTDDNVSHVGVLDLATGERKTLADNAQDASYSPTGHLVFARGTTLMAAPLDTAELALTGEPVPVLQDVRHPSPTTGADYSLSANGTLVYVSSGTAVTRRRVVVWVDRTGQAVQRAIAEPVENAINPRLSPDGTRLLLSAGSPSTAGLWSYDLRGRPPIPLAITGFFVVPVWSPDGREVAFGSPEGPSIVQIMRIAADGSARLPLPFRPEGLPGVPDDWSASGELFFHAWERPDIEVISTTAAGGERKVVATESDEYDAALSPNGRWLAYTSNRSGQAEVWVQGYPDGVAVRLSPSGGYEPRWSANGRELFYLQGNAMMSAAVQTGGEFSFAAPKRLFTGPYNVSSSWFFRSYDVGRDGRFLMIQKSNDEDVASGLLTPGGSIVVVRNWAEELKRRVPTKSR